MMLSSLLMLVLAIILYNIFNEVNSAGLPNQMFTKISLTEKENSTPNKNVEFVNNLDYKFETLMKVVNKMDNSIQNLQEKSQTWAIFHHHIESWNDGIRILENKLDLIKRTQEEQLNKLERSINRININDDDGDGDNHNSILDEVKQLLNNERKFKTDISSKINNILRHVQNLSGNEKQQNNRMANIMGPPIVANGGGGGGAGGVAGSCSHKIEQRLSTILHQMAQQKELKQLNSLEKRNFKSLETINQSLTDHLDKQEEIVTRLQKSNECCYELSSELTTFTESSDILLKRIEKLVRNVSEKLNDIEISSSTSPNDNDNSDDKEVDNNHGHDVRDSEENNEDHSNDHTEEIVDDETVNDDHVEEIEEVVVSASDNVNIVEHDINQSETIEDNVHEVEFLRPYLNGCHELPLDEADVEDDTTRIDGIYKFSTPEINDAERDFYERYCVFPSRNDTGLPWTVVQHRDAYQQQENFNRSWSEYRNGFGHLSKDFWFGNEYIHRLVYHDDYELRIELEDFNKTQKWAEYTIFRVDSEKYNYNLLIGEYQGTAEDAMKYHNENDFSTYDRRNDKTVDACCSCALGYASGWWFDNCSEANLNGVYHYTPLGHNYIGIMWELWHGDYSLKKTRMMIRPRNLNTNPTINIHDYHEYNEDP